MQEYYIDLWKQDSTKTKANNITKYFNKKGEKMIEFILITIWLFVAIVCLEGIFNVVVRGYYDYKNNKKLKQLKKNIK